MTEKQAKAYLGPHQLEVFSRRIWVIADRHDTEFAVVIIPQCCIFVIHVLRPVVESNFVPIQ
jgi:hypothetical protein